MGAPPALTSYYHPKGDPTGQVGGCGLELVLARASRGPSTSAGELGSRATREHPRERAAAEWDILSQVRQIVSVCQDGHTTTHTRVRTLFQSETVAGRMHEARTRANRMCRRRSSVVYGDPTC